MSPHDNEFMDLIGRNVTVPADVPAASGATISGEVIAADADGNIVLVDRRGGTWQSREAAIIALGLCRRKTDRPASQIHPTA